MPKRKQITSDDLQGFFADRPALNKTVFAKEADISRQYLFLLLAGEREMSDQVARNLSAIMRKYGYIRGR